MPSMLRTLAICIVVAIATACATRDKSYHQTSKIAVEYYNQRNFELAEQYHRKALEEMRAEPDVSAATLSIQLANVASSLVQLGKTREAKPYLKEALEIQARQPAEDVRVLAQVNSLLARCDELDGDFDAAENTYIKALDQALQVKNWPIHHVGFIMAGLANTYVHKNELDLAEQYFQKAKELYAAQLGENSTSWQYREIEYVKLRDAALETRVRAK